MSHDVFISYSTKDKLTADAVCGTLEGRGIRCWIAPRDIAPGQDWSEAIIDGLTSTPVFVLLLSETSNNSEQVKREVQNAVSEGMTIVPLRLEDIALSKHMRYFIGTPHWLDALTPPMEAHLERLAQTIHALLQARERTQKEEVSMPVTFSPSPISPPPPPTPKALPMGETDWNPEELRRVERELAVFIGPMARILVHQGAMKMPDMEALCQHLSQYIPGEDDKARFFKATSHLNPAPKSAAPAGASGRAGVKAWDADMLQKIERQFAIHIGPLARVLVKRASQRAETLDDLYGLLAEHLQSAAEKERFLKSRLTV